MTALQVERQWNRNGPNLADDLLGGRVDGGECLAADGVDILVVDEQLGELDFGLHVGGVGSCDQQRRRRISQRRF